MVIVTGRFVVAPEDVDAFLASRLDGIRASRNDAGCITYTFAADPLEAGLVHLFERWESQAALDAHIARMRSGPQTPPAVAVQSAEILVCDASNFRPLG